MNTHKKTILKMKLAILLIGAMLLLALGQTRPALAATITVNSNTASGGCTFNEAVATANRDDGYNYNNGCGVSYGADIITLAIDVELTGGANGFNSEVILEGNGYTIDGNGYSVIRVGTSGNVTINNVTITGSHYINGGAINVGGGNVTVNNSTLTGNQGVKGGGIYNNNGTITVNNSTISGNSPSGNGGGIYNTGTNGTVILNNSTVSGNLTTSQGGGIYVYSGTVFVNRSIVSGNSASSGAEVYKNSGTVNANNYNLFGHSGFTNAQAFVNFSPGANDRTATSNGTHPTVLTAILDTVLADNGGPTWTHALVSGSPALDFAPNADCTAAPISGVDQRGSSRPVDGDGTPSDYDCDAGAFEVQLP